MATFAGATNTHSLLIASVYLHCYAAGSEYLRIKPNWPVRMDGSTTRSGSCFLLQTWAGRFRLTVGNESVFASVAVEAAVDKVPPNSGFSLCGISRSETGLMWCDENLVTSIRIWEQLKGDDSGRWQPRCVFFAFLMDPEGRSGLKDVMRHS